MGEATNADSFVDLALCVVCDIRGFTTMQTRVHEFVFESIKHDRKAADRVRKAYKEYVEVSQAAAHEILTAPLQKRKVVGTKGFAIKSTGDGYMIAVDVPRNDDHLFGESVFEISNLIASAYSLAESSDLTSDGYFGRLTGNFLARYGNHIGINITDVKKEMRRRGCHPAVKHNSRFRIAVGVSMGFTTFFRQPHPPRHQDVSGYGVNLAFRLCDQAGRGYDPEDKRCTPAVLLDRRVGNALLRFRESPFRVLPWNEQLYMKGFEEAWAYYLAPRRKPSAR